MKSHATRNPAPGPSDLPGYGYSPPADGNRFASCPIAVAAQMHAINARPTDSGSACCDCGTEMKIEYATAAAGAMCVIDWKSTCGKPIECSRRWSNRRSSPGAATAISPSLSNRMGDLIKCQPGASIPGRRIVHPAPGDHRRHDLHLGQFGVVGVSIEDDEIGVAAGDERAADAFVVREPGGRDARRMQRLIERQPLVLAPVPLDGGEDSGPRIELLDGRVGAVGD